MTTGWCLEGSVETDDGWEVYLCMVVGSMVRAVMVWRAAGSMVVQGRLGGVWTLLGLILKPPETVELTLALGLRRLGGVLRRMG